MLPEIEKDKSLIPDVPGFEQFALTDDDVLVPTAPTAFIDIRGESYQQTLERLILKGGNPEKALTEAAQKYTEAYDQAVERDEIKAEEFTK